MDSAQRRQRAINITYVTVLILGVWNIIVFSLYGIDKLKAKRNRSRISEKTLLFATLMMGGVGTLLGMYAFRHKTKHAKFKIGVPLLLVVNIVVVVAIMLFVGNGDGSDVTTEISLPEVLVAANERRDNIIKPDYNQLLALTAGRTPTTENLAPFQEQMRRLRFIPKSDAIADVHDFFGLMRDLYGGYVYFGGDEVFSAILDDIIADIEAHRGNNIGRSAFERILHTHLSAVIVDNHFTIGNQRFSRSSAFYHAPDGLVFVRGYQGFRSANTERYLVEAEGHKIDDIMRLHVTGTGQFVYSPVILRIDENLPSRLTIAFVYDDGTRENIVFRRENTRRRRHQEPSLQYIEGIPVVTVRQMDFPESTARRSADARAFLSFAEVLRAEPVVIVDIRSNGGGNGNLPARWLHVLTGEIVPTNHVWLRAWDYEENLAAIRTATPESPFYSPEEIFRRYMNPAPFGDGYMIMGNAPDRIIERDQLLVLLVDRFTASAAEGFADKALNMQNTLIIGSHTGGVLNFDLTWPSLRMPRSGVPLGMGTAMIVHPYGHLVEGVGIAPDIWVHGDALDAAIAMLGLNNDGILR